MKMTFGFDFETYLAYHIQLREKNFIHLSSDSKSRDRWSNKRKIIFTFLLRIRAKADRFKKSQIKVYFFG